MPRLRSLPEQPQPPSCTGFPSLRKWSAPPSCVSDIAIAGARAQANYRRIRLRA